MRFVEVGVIIICSSSSLYGCICILFLIIFSYIVVDVERFIELI